MTTLNTLTAIRGRITLRENWCQHIMMNGDAVCVRGAAYAVADEWAADAAILALAVALPAGYRAPCGPISCVSIFNDTHTHAEVLALVDSAMAIERRKLGLTDISALTALLDSRQHEPELELMHG